MLSNIALPTVIGAAALDSINPCAFAVLIFLGTYLIAIKAQNRILKIGLTYIATVYLVYFLAGLGLLSALNSFQVTNAIYYLAGALLIILGLLDIKDFFVADVGPTLKIPESAKPLIEKWTKRTSIPAAIVLGFIVSAFELPCTGGIYLAIITLLSKESSQIPAIAYLLIYNLIFVLPLLIILGILNLGESSARVKEWQKAHKKSLRLIMGLGMVLLGLLMVLRII
jgi:cytochrome c biogenesis protein CcdA